MRVRSEEQDERRRDLILIAALVLLVSSFYLDVLLLGNGFFTRDLMPYHYPMKKVVRDTVLDGQFPFWNPWFAGGQPMAANPAYEVFYPPQWLTLIPDYDLGFRLHILVHVWLAVIGAFLFLRSRRVGRAVAFVGAAAFVMGGPFVSVFNLLPFMFSVAWAPWVALFASRYFESRSRVDLSLLVIVLGMQAIICEPTTLLQTWFLLGLYGAWQGWQQAGNRRVLVAARGFLGAVVAVVAGTVLAAVQFLPAIDHASDSVRQLGFPWEHVSKWSFPPVRLAELVYPTFLGSIEDGMRTYLGRALYPDANGPYLYSVYVGLPLLALAIAGVVVRRRMAGFVVTAVGVSIVLALGSWTPFFRQLYDANLLPAIRYPEKFMLLGSLVILAWGCLVLDDVLRGDRRAARVTLVVLVASAVVALGFFAWSFTPGYAAWFERRWSPTDEGLVSLSRINWLVAVGRGLAFAAIIELCRRTRVRAALVLLVLAIVADLGPLGNQINPRMPRRFFDPPASMATLSEQADGSRMLHLRWLDRDFARIPRKWAYDTYWTQRSELVPTMPAAWGVPVILELDVDETQLLHTREFMLLAIEHMKERDRPPGEPAAWRDDAVRQVAAMTNVGVVASMLGDGTWSGEGDVETYVPVVFEKIDGGPRYYFAGEIVPVAGLEWMFAMLEARKWPPTVAFVEGQAGKAWGRVHSVREEANRISIEAEALGDATLVASVTRHKYWSATIDGEPVPILPVNHAFQGIPFGLGRHRVELRYFNPLVPVGGIVTVTMAAGLFIGLVGATRRRSRLSPE